MLADIILPDWDECSHFDLVLRHACSFEEAIKDTFDISSIWDIMCFYMILSRSLLEFRFFEEVSDHMGFRG